MQSEGRSHTRRVEASAADDGPAGLVEPGGQLFEIKPELRVCLVVESSIGELHLLGGGIPYLGRPLYHLAPDVLGRFVAGPPRLEGHAAPARRRSKAH